MRTQATSRALQVPPVSEVYGLWQDDDPIPRKIRNDPFPQILISRVDVAEITAAEPDEDRVTPDCLPGTAGSVIADASPKHETAVEIRKQPARDGENEEVSRISVHRHIDDRNIGGTGNPTGERRERAIPETEGHLATSVSAFVRLG